MNQLRSIWNQMIYYWMTNGITEPRNIERGTSRYPS